MRTLNWNWDGVPGGRINREYASRWLTASRASPQAVSGSHAPHAVPDRAVNPLLTLCWRGASHFAMQGGVCMCRERASMSPDALNSFFQLCIGFALAGAIASAYQAFAKRPPSFSLLQQGRPLKPSQPCRCWSSRRPSSSCATRLKRRSRAASHSVRDDRDGAVGHLEPDVGHLDRDDPGSAGHTGLSARIRGSVSRKGRPLNQRQSTNSTGRDRIFRPAEITLSPTRPM